MFRCRKRRVSVKRGAETLSPTSASATSQKRFEPSVGAMPAASAVALARLAWSSKSRRRASFSSDDAPIVFFARGTMARSSIEPRFARPCWAWAMTEPATSVATTSVSRRSSRLIRRDRRGFARSRSIHPLKMADGEEMRASAVTFWPAEDRDDAGATLVFFADLERPKRRRSRTATISGSTDGHPPPPGPPPAICAPFSMRRTPGAATVLDSNAALNWK